MRGVVALVALVALPMGVGGCGTREEPAPPATPPAAFVADDDGAGPAVFLRGRADGEKVLVDVVARGAPDVHGAVLRLRFDPKMLGFASAEAGGLWSKKALSVAREGTAGQLAIAWTEMGEVGVEAKSEAILGTIAFHVRAKGASAIAFRPERCALVDRHGAVVPVAWRGGSLPAAAR